MVRWSSSADGRPSVTYIWLGNHMLGDRSVSVDRSGMDQRRGAVVAVLDRDGLRNSCDEENSYETLQVVKRFD